MKSLSCPQAHSKCLSAPWTVLSFTPSPFLGYQLFPYLCIHTSVSLCRESKELADLARLHPTNCAPNGLNPNLMVTGGPTLAGSGRWSADPAAHLATHPWLPRSGSTSMWLAGHPYGECSFVEFLSLRGGWGHISLFLAPSKAGVTHLSPFCSNS